MKVDVLISGFTSFVFPLLVAIFACYANEFGINKVMKKVTFFILSVLVAIYIIWAIWWHIDTLSSMKDGALRVKDIMAIASIMIFINIMPSAVVFVCFWGMLKRYLERDIARLKKGTPEQGNKPNEQI